MPTLPIIEVPDPLLRAQSLPVERIDDEVQHLIDDMFATMYAAPGIGLAAVQVAVPRRLLIIDLQEPAPTEGDAPEDEAEPQVVEPVRNPLVFINPEILALSDEMQTYDEGCLSIPDHYAEVERPARVRARWLDREGKTQEGEVDGLLAVCLQHEIDHLDGVLFIDHISRLKRDIILKKLAKSRKLAA